MKERFSRLLPLMGTLLLHVAVVWWLMATPEQRAEVLRAVEMDVVDLPPEPEPEPEPESEPEPEPEPDPEPEPVKQRPRQRIRVEEPPEPEETQPNEQPDEEPDQEQVQDESPEPPAMLDFGEQNLAAPGTGAGWSMRTSNGSSNQGLYQRGDPNRSSGGGGGGPPRSTEPPPRPDFAPVPGSQLSRDPSLVGTINRDYPAEARRQAIEGTVRLLVEIRSNGRVRNVRILTDPGGGLGRAAAERLRRARFRPAQDRNGRPVDTRIIYTVRYLLDE